MRCALIDSKTRKVINLIVADPETDKLPDGYEMLAVPDENYIEMGWTHSHEEGFVEMTAYEAKQRLEKEAEDAKPENTARVMIEADADEFLRTIERV